MKTNLNTFLTLFLFISFTSVINIVATYDIDEESNSLLLTKQNFHDAEKENDYLLVNFHALWCQYSKRLHPEWIALSQKLRNEASIVKLAKVEAYDEKSLADEYNIEGYPTIKLFIKQQPHDYTGERTAIH